ncbi:MAG: tetratricopeptide repeat protein, partial [Tepidisphaeraceae bacterium]
VLMIAQATTATPGGARAALDVVTQHEANLKPDAPATPQVMALKLRLLMELGLTAEAESLASRMTTSGALPSETALRLADMLAERYAGSDAAPPPQARDQVVQFVSRGLASHPHDATYRDAALAGVRTLLKVKAYSDAQQILAGIKASGAEKDSTPALLMAQALQGQGKVEEAQRILDDVTRDNPEAGDVHLAMGRLQQQLQQWEKSAAAYRSARKQLPVGRDAWWQATIGLADALAQQGNVAGAQELLRVANAMYRNRAPVSLLPRIDALLKQPAGTVESRNGRNG